MNKLVSVCGLLSAIVVSWTVSAAQVVKLDMKLELDGKTSHSQVITSTSSPASITQVDSKTGDGYEIKVTPSLEPRANEDAVQAVRMEFEVVRLTAGVRTVLFSPRATTLVGKSATFTTESGPAHPIRLEVVPSIEQNL